MPTRFALFIAVLLLLFHWALPQRASVVFIKQLTFAEYSFQITAPDTGSVREVAIQARRSDRLLIAYRMKVDAPVIQAEVADLDQNRLPELYLYTATSGSGSFGHVVGWQFMLNRLAEIQVSDWKLPADAGYMGHDSLWTEQAILCRRFPIYTSGDANAYPSGGFQMVRYRLKPRGEEYVLEKEEKD